MTLSSALKRQRQVDFCSFEASLFNMASPRTARIYIETHDGGGDGDDEEKSPRCGVVIKTKESVHKRAEKVWWCRWAVRSQGLRKRSRI